MRIDQLRKGDFFQSWSGKVYCVEEVTQFYVRVSSDAGTDYFARCAEVSQVERV